MSERQKNSYVYGLKRAEQDGYDNGLYDWGLRNPYKRLEHQRCWDEGFMRGQHDRDAELKDKRYD